MPRGSRFPSEVFNSVLSKAAKRLLLNAAEADDFKHKGIKGDERASALADFLKEHLPNRFDVLKGEAIDYLDRRSAQLDILVYDHSMCSPLKTGKENLLVPAESLFAVIEVKSILTKQHAESIYHNVALLKRLRPYKQSFVSADKTLASNKQPRCMYVVFAYASDLSKKHWAATELARLENAAKEEGQEVGSVDRVVVLDRGLMIPQSRMARLSDSTEIFFDFYLHFINFISREQKRRAPIDWQGYGPRTTPGWAKIN